MKMKKAQAAMEFLMTYGWAILVVLVVIGALAYFGVLNPQTLLPERCELQQGLYCKDHQADGSVTDTVTLRLENGRGTGIVIDDIVLTGTDFSAVCDWDPLPADVWKGFPGRRLANGEASSFVTATCAPSIAGLVDTGKKKFSITLNWWKDDSDPSFGHTMEGQLIATIE